MKKRIFLSVILFFSLVIPHAWEGDVWTESLQKINSIVSVIESSYFQEVDHESLAHSSINGMLQTLDPHSYFLSLKNLRTLQEEYRGKYHGLGIMIQKLGDSLVVITPIEGTPAYRLGILAGDVISHIEGESTKTLSSFEAMQKLRGPKGTKVNISITREGLDEPIQFTIKRAEIPLYSVPYAFILRDDIGYIYIRNFATTTADEFREKMQLLKKLGMKKLILDMRWNGGGTFPGSIEISDEFLPKDSLIVSIRGRKEYYNREFPALHDNQHEDIPLIILINRGSASAPEIVCGAVMDNDRGLIIGEDSFGKGLVQTLFPLSKDSAVALTTAKYYTPSGRSIQRDYSQVDDYLFNRDVPKDEEREVRYTVGGRKVLGQGGITPDYKVEFSLKRLTYDAVRKGGVFAYAKKFIEKKTPASSQYILPNKQKGEFEEPTYHIIDRDFSVDSEILEDFKADLKEQDFPFTEEDFEEAKDQLAREIEKEIFSFLWGVEGGWWVYRNSDPVVQRAIELLPEAESLIKN
ncbi:MAG: S41 family peptidase [Candidatus Aminicenantes bacterium]|nr:S41 family peptidase [Candidatus Aminicenantes bacterium]